MPFMSVLMILAMSHSTVLFHGRRICHDIGDFLDRNTETTMQQRVQMQEPNIS